MNTLTITCGRAPPQRPPAIRRLTATVREDDSQRQPPAVGESAPARGQRHGGRHSDGRDLRGLGPPVDPPIFEVAPADGIRARNALFRRSLIAADVAAATAALLVSVLLISGASLRPPALLAPALLVLCSKLSGLYDREEMLIDKGVTIDEIPRLFSVATLLALLLAIAGDVIVHGGISLPIAWLSLLAFLVIFRAGARATALRHTDAERCLVIGDADAYDQLQAKLAGSPRVNTVVVGYVPLGDRIRSDDPAPLGTLTQLDGLILNNDVHRVIVAPRDIDAGVPLEVVRRVKALGVGITVVPRLLEIVGSSVEFDDIDGMTVLGVRRFGLLRSSLILKRAFDLSGAVMGLVLGAPLFAAVALAIRRDSPGPVFFRQTRVGRDGEVFQIVKFRTMVVDAEAQKAALRDGDQAPGLFKIAGDPRITRPGRWLRRTSLDELPQLINVVRGQMSLVGPRPLVLDEDIQVEGWHRRRLYLKPGMTGPWQILGSGRIPLYEMVKMDYLYIANWSVWNDVKLLMRTVPGVLARRGL
ncbi:MAG: sugar transferase [Chloroflexota bacterium]|nr:sugar transferase [Chloroflexota bacterium]